jgi:hypothetical protein
MYEIKDLPAILFHHFILELIIRWLLLSIHMYLLTMTTIYYDFLTFELDTENSELYLALLRHLGPNVDDEIGWGMNVNENFDILRRRRIR